MHLLNKEARMEFSSQLINRIGQIRALVLDMDGVLVDTEPLHMEAFRRYLQKLGLPHDDAYIFSFIGFSVPDNIRNVFHRFYQNPSEEMIAQGIRERDAIYLQLLHDTPLRPLPGIRELIDFCQKQNLKIALASSSDREQILTIFENLKRTSQGLFDPSAIFDLVLSGEDVAQRKPHPAIYQQASEKLGVAPKTALAIEDSPAGVQSAKEAGLLCLALKSKFIEDKKLAAADALLDSVNDAVQLCRKAFSTKK